jgi:tetratricopeptide (TPR) repeat protein
MDLRRVVRVRERIAARQPDNMRFRRLLGWGRVFFGAALVDCGHAALALPHLERGRAIQKQVYDTDPENKRMIKDLAWAHGHLGNAYLKLDRPLDAIQSYDAAVALAQKALAKDGEIRSDGRMREVAVWQTQRAKARLANNNVAGGRDDIATAIAYLGNENMATDRSNLQLRSERARAIFVSALIERKAGNPEAGELFAEARRKFEDIVTEAPNVPRWQRELAEIDREWGGEAPFVVSLDGLALNDQVDQSEKPLDILVP